MWVRAHTAHLEALELPHTLLSASELRSDFRNVFLDNSQPGTFKHVFASLEDQLDGKPCLLHSDRACCDSCDGSRPSLMMSGSPCDPFSQQSGKRFQPGAVSGHKLFNVTMNSIIDMYVEKEPPIGLFEQVMGFVMPFDPSTPETPYQRRGDTRHKQTFSNAVYSPYSCSEFLQQVTESPTFYYHKIILSCLMSYLILY